MRILAFDHGGVLESTRGSYELVGNEPVFRNHVDDQDLVYKTNAEGQTVFVPEGREVLPQLARLAEDNPEVLLAFHSKNKVEDQTEMLRLLQSKLITIGGQPVPFRLMPAFDKTLYGEISSEAPQFSYVNRVTLEIMEERPSPETVDDFIIVAAWGHDDEEGKASVRRALEKAAQHYAELKGIDYSLDKAHSHIFDDDPGISFKAQQEGWQGHLISYGEESPSSAQTLLQAVNGAVVTINSASEVQHKPLVFKFVPFADEEVIIADYDQGILTESLIRFEQRFQTILRESRQRGSASLWVGQSNFATVTQPIKTLAEIIASCVSPPLIHCKDGMDKTIAIEALRQAARGVMPTAEADMGASLTTAAASAAHEVVAIRGSEAPLSMPAPTEPQRSEVVAAEEDSAFETASPVVTAAKAAAIESKMKTMWQDLIEIIRPADAASFVSWLPSNPLFKAMYKKVYVQALLNQLGEYYPEEIIYCAYLRAAAIYEADPFAEVPIDEAAEAVINKLETDEAAAADNAASHETPQTEVDTEVFAGAVGEGTAYGVTTKPSLSNHLLVGVGVGLMCGGLAAVTVLTFGAALLPALILGLGSSGAIVSGAVLGATLGAGLGYLAHKQGLFAKPAHIVAEERDEDPLLPQAPTAAAQS